MATTTAVPQTRISGGSFLLEERKPDEVFTPEDFTEQHQLIAQTAEEFAVNEIVPNIEKLTFTGRETVKLSIRAPVRELVLNVLMMPSEGLSGASPGVVGILFEPVRVGADVSLRATMVGDGSALRAVRCRGRGRA